MYSVIVLICNMAYTECMTFAPRSVFKTEEMCEVTAEANLPAMKNSLPPNSNVSHQCISWGVPA